MASPALARIRIGVEACVNVSTLDYFHEPQVSFLTWNNGWRPSFTAGAVVDIPIHRRFALTTGLRYVQQGNTVEITVVGPPAVGEFRVLANYLAVPVLLEFRPIATSGFFLSLGPEVGFLVSGRLQTELRASGPGYPFEGSQDIHDDLEDVNVTIDGAAGFAFPLGGHEGTVQLRYTHGTTSAAKKERWVSDWSTQGVEFLTGLRW